MRSSRLLVLSVLLASLSGCVADEEPEEDPLVSVCPQWVEGPYPMEETADVNGSAELTLAPERNGSLVETHDGWPLDLYVVTVTTDAPVTVRAATGDGRNLLLRDDHGGEPDSRPALEVDGERTFALYLTAVAHGTDADPGTVVLDLEGSGSVQVTATPWYRVCGAALSPPEDR